MDNKEAINYLSKEGKSVFQSDTDMLQAIDMAIEALKEKPQGEWKYTHDTFSKRVCNKCNYSQVIVDGMADNFCPNCGAKMKQVITCVNPCGDSTTIDTSKKTIC